MLNDNRIRQQAGSYTCDVVFQHAKKSPASLPGFSFADADYGTNLSSRALSRTAPLSALVASKA